MTQWRSFFQLAVDGPAGCGKSSCTALAAKKLGFFYVDSGALYRCIALKSMRQGTPKDWASFIHSTHIELHPSVSPSPFLTHVVLDDQDVTAAIRERDVTHQVSQLAALPLVRAALLLKQRAMADPRPGYLGVAMEGRDIGTVVLEKAHLKLYLTADAEIRALRRWKEVNAPPHVLDQILHDLVQRDHMDQTRELGKLKVADDAMVLDTSTLSQEETVEAMVQLVQDRMQLLSKVDASG